MYKKRAHAIHIHIHIFISELRSALQLWSKLEILPADLVLMTSITEVIYLISHISSLL